MKLVRGRTLQSVLSDIRVGDEKTILEFPLSRLLTIYRQICDAMSFAHHRGVLHRDLKPQNVMIGEFGETLVMDWGLAKGIEDMQFPGMEQSEDDFVSPAAATVPGDSQWFNDLIRTDAPEDHGLTLDGAVLGSPQFMAPEQAQGRIADIDARTDVYALGGLLYAILTLTPPVGGESIDEVLRNVKSGNIAPPASFNVRSRSSAAHARAAPRPAVPPKSTSPLRHCPGGRIPPALSAVAMRALRMAPQERYPDVAALADDIDAHQSGHATTAEEISPLGLLALFYRRNKGSVISASIALAAILAGLAISVSMYFGERAARRRADTETEKSRQVARFLEDTLNAVGPSAAMGRDTTLMREILDKTAVRIGDELRSRPRISAELSRIIGNVYNDLREFTPAIAQLESAMRLRRELHPGDHPELAGCILDYAAALEMAGRVNDAEPFAREALEMWRRLEGADSREAANAETLVGWILLLKKRPGDGEAMSKHAMEIWRRNPGAESLTEAPNTLATIYEHTDRNDLAVEIYREELESLRKRHPDGHPLIVNCLDNYGTQLMRMKRDAEAEPLFLESLEMGRKFFDDRNPDEDHVLTGLAAIAGRRGDLDAQLEYARQSRDTGARVYPPGHRYWNASQRGYLNVVLGQIETHLDVALAAPPGPNRQPSLARAEALIAELKAQDGPESIIRPESPWTAFLSAMAKTLAAQDTNGPAPTDLAKLEAGKRALAAKAKTSTTWKSRSQKASKWLARLRGKE